MTGSIAMAKCENQHPADEYRSTPKLRRNWAAHRIIEGTCQCVNAAYNCAMSKTKYHLLIAPALLTAASFALGGCSKEQAKPEAERAVEAPVSDKAAEKSKETKPATQAISQDKLAEVAGTYEIDPVHSAAVFAVQHFGAGYVYGMLPKVTGKYVLEGDLDKGSVQIEIDTQSVFTADKKRDDHLKSPDFFNAKQFPKIEFKSRQIKAAESKIEVSGDLTLHGVTKPLTLELEYTGSGTNPMSKASLTGFRGTASIKRSDFDMKTMIGPAGDKIDLIVAIEGIKQ